MERKRNYIYPDRESLAASFVCEISRTLRECSDQQKELHIALSGGSTPQTIFRMLADETTKDDWADVYLYWGDERCVPSDHPDSNYGFVRKVLLKPLGIADKQIQAIRGDERPLGEAARYGDLLMQQLPVENGFPVFDWIWLGLGTDGHTASIFPENIELWTAGTPCIVSSHPGTAQPRISITGGVINNARRVSFIVSGQEKASVIREIFFKEDDYMDYPAFYVDPASGNLEWYLDQHAARYL